MKDRTLSGVITVAMILLIAGAVGWVEIVNNYFTTTDGWSYTPKTQATSIEQQMDAVVQIKTEMDSGTGFFVDGKGTVVTAYHVIEFADGLKVIDNQLNEYNAVIIQTMPDIDLAIIRIITDKETPFLKVAKAESPVGSEAYIIGYPWGQKNTYTRGYVSHNSRKGIFSDVLSCIQIDTPINGGNSGSPVFNMCGEVIGVVSYKSNNADGLGFAVSCDYLRPWL